ncbi:HD domain-containing protein [Thermovibrio ammonificans]
MEKRIHKFTFYHPKLEKLQECLVNGRCYIVGGFIRDRLLRVAKEKVDIDVVCFKPQECARCIEETLKKKPFVIEREKAVFSFCGPDWRIDLTRVDGATVEEDLLKRDFTINALAVDLRELFLPFNDDALIIDPTGGLEDLQKGLVRPVSEGALRADPLRVLRGVRIKNELDFTYHPSFLKLAREAAEGLKSVAPERIKEELVKCLKGGFFALALRELDEIGALFPVFPELQGIEKVPPSGFHQFNLKEHTLRTVEWVERLAERAEEMLSEEAGVLFKNSHLPELPDIGLLELAALYHDVAKPQTMKEENGKLTFYGHDALGAEIAFNAMLRLSFGKRSAKLVKNVIRHHLRPFFLFELFKKGELTERAIYRFFRDTKPYAPHVLLHGAADLCATSREKEKELPLYTEFTRHLIKFFKERIKNLKPLLTGEEIMEIKGLSKPGKCVGKIKEKLLELQALGKVSTKEEAAKLVKGIHCESGN